MKNLWITFFRIYIKTGLFFYYKKIIVKGVENIPKNKAVLFVSNHQNGLIDPLIIGTTNERSTHFLTRAGVFNKKLLIYFFNSVQMIPIYRIRDGWQSLSKNDAIFNKCFQLLNEKKALVIFPEGGHNLKRQIRPLSKGFTRIIFGAFKKHPELDIQIVPVGLNYNSILEYPTSVSIYYGKPISAKKYWNENDITSSVNDIKAVLSDEMKKLTTHIDINSNYENTYQQLIHSNVNLLNPFETNKYLKSVQTSNPQPILPTKHKSLIRLLFIINSLIPWLLWKLLQSKTTELEFVSTFRFSLGITLFPTFYAVQSILIYSQFNLKFAVLYFGISILLVLSLTKISRIQKDKI